MKKSGKKKIAAQKAKNSRKPVSVVIDKKLDSLSNRILFGKKLEKANHILASGGFPT